MRPIYLDNHATTPTDPRVAAVVLRYMTEAFGNASSVDHPYGDEAEAAVENARREVASLVGASPRDVVFVSGATEALNLAIQGFVRVRGTHGRVPAPVRIGVTPIEHRAVLDPIGHLAREGLISVTWLQVDSRGQLDLDQARNVCARGLDLLCVMAANNEVGTILPLSHIAAVARSEGIPLLTDATQAAGRIPLSFTEWGLAFLALSAHKLYGPKGVGALVVTRDAALEPLSYGGGHERGLRPGTLNVPGIAGLGEACRLRRMEMATDESRVAAQRDRLEGLLVEGIDELAINGDRSARLAGNLHISIPGVSSSVIVARLRNAVAVARGAACASAAETPSHVLRALGLPDPLIRGALRLGLGKFTTDDEVERAGDYISQAVLESRPALQR